MSLLQGNITAHRLLALGPVPDEATIAKGLAEHQFRPFQDGVEEIRTGTADWRNLMIVPPDPDYVMIDTRYVIFGLRADTRKVPPAMLKAHIDLRLQRLMQEQDLAFIGKEGRISIQDEVKLDLLKKIMPTPKMVDVVWNTKTGQVWTIGATASLKSEIAKIFLLAFGIEMRPYGMPDWVSAAGSTIGPRLETLDALQIGDSTSACESADGRFLAEEFLLWLWMEGLASGGSSGVKDDLSSCFVDENLLLVNDHYQVKEQTLRKGNPAESIEAFDALQRGMRPSKLRMRLLEGDMEWMGTLSADNLSFTGLKLPPSSAKDPSGRASDRVFLIEEVFGHLEKRFGVFLKNRLDDPKGLEDKLTKWAKEGSSGESDSAPWEEDADESETVGSHAGKG